MSHSLPTPDITNILALRKYAMKGVRVKDHDVCNLLSNDLAIVIIMVTYESNKIHGQIFTIGKSR